MHRTPWCVKVAKSYPRTSYLVCTCSWVFYVTLWGQTTLRSSQHHMCWYMGEYSMSCNMCLSDEKFERSGPLRPCFEYGPHFVQHIGTVPFWGAYILQALALQHLIFRFDTAGKVAKIPSFLFDNLLLIDQRKVLQIHKKQGDEISKKVRPECWWAH